MQIRLFELHFIKETTLESLVHILGKIGCGNKNAIKLLYLLKNDILDIVLQFIHSLLCTHHTLTDDGICLIEEQNRSLCRLFHHLSVIIKDTLDVLFALPYPHTLDIRDVNLYKVTTRFPGYLKNRLRLSSTWCTIE